MVDVKAEAPDLSKQTLSDGCLLVAFEENLTLALTGSCPPGQFKMGGRLYKDQGYGDWTGFYDWLRVDSDRIIGVRYCPFEPPESLFRDLSSLSYVHPPLETPWIEARSIEVLFSLPTVADPRISDDQEFGSNKIFRSEPQGKWLISFDTTRLSELEMQSIRAANARWEPAVMSGNGDARGLAAEAPAG